MDSTSKKLKIEDFEMTKEIGQGAYGTVYLGRERATGKQVAIKSVNKD